MYSPSFSFILTYITGEHRWYVATVGFTHLFIYCLTIRQPSKDKNIGTGAINRKFPPKLHIFSPPYYRSTSDHGHDGQYVSC